MEMDTYRHQCSPNIIDDNRKLLYLKTVNGDPFITVPLFRIEENYDAIQLHS